MKTFLKSMCASVVLFGTLMVCAGQAVLAEEARTRVVAKASVDVGNLADGAGETLTITVPGAALGDACVASLGVDLQDMTVNCYVQAANAVEVRVQNESGGAINLASTTLRVFLFPKGTN